MCYLDAQNEQKASPFASEELIKQGFNNSNRESTVYRRMLKDIHSSQYQIRQLQGFLGNSPDTVLSLTGYERLIGKPAITVVPLLYLTHNL